MNKHLIFNLLQQSQGHKTKQNRSDPSANPFQRWESKKGVKWEKINNPPPTHTTWWNNKQTNKNIYCHCCRCVCVRVKLNRKKAYKEQTITNDRQANIYSWKQNELAETGDGNPTKQTQIAVALIAIHKRKFHSLEGKWKIERESNILRISVE